MDNIVRVEKEFDIIIEPGFKKAKFDCPVCKLALAGLEDVESVENYGACCDCTQFFYWPNKDRWKSGWRPKKEQVHRKLNNYYVVKEK